MALFCLIEGVFENRALPFFKIGRYPFSKLGVTLFQNWALPFFKIVVLTLKVKDLFTVKLMEVYNVKLIFKRG